MEAIEVGQHGHIAVLKLGDIGQTSEVLTQLFDSVDRATEVWQAKGLRETQGCSGCGSLGLVDVIDEDVVDDLRTQLEADIPTPQAVCSTCDGSGAIPYIWFGKTFTPGHVTLIAKVQDEVLYIKATRLLEVS